MPAISELSTDQVNTIRSGGFAGQVRVAVDPSPVVFQCEVDETLVSSVFLSFAWDNTLQGDYEDVAPDMTVLNTYEALQMDRSGALVDGYLSYQNLPPAIKNMQSFYYGEDETEYPFSFAPVGQAMAQGATIDAYHWTFPAGTVYDTGDDDTQNITVTVPYGHHWVFLDVTDSNDVTMRFKFEILVCDRDDTDFMFEAHGDVSINGEVETGWAASVSYFAGVEALLNRTRVAIVVFDDYKSGDGIFPNVMFTGYLVQEDTSITADELSSTLAETSFEIQSFTAIIAQLPVPSLAIRNSASPSAWEQINLPTTQRVIWHLISRYSTFGSLCAIDFVTTDSTWFGGEMDLEATTLLESINHIAEEINAKLVFFPQGDATLEINANFLSDDDRNDLPNLIASGSITPDDLFGYSLPLPYYDTVGQLEAGFATFYTDGSTPVKLSGVAPATARQEGTESPVVLAQLLNANLTQVAAIAAAKQRIGDLLEWLNPPVLIPFTAHDGWHFLTPSTRVWVNFDLPATDSTRGLAVEASARYLLLSIALTWHSDGTFDVTGAARLETQGGLSQVNVSVAPNVVNTDLPVLPIAPDYDAFVPDGTLNYLSTDVPEEDRQPFRGGAYVQFSPMPTGDAQNAADQYPEPTCQIISPPVNFASSGTRFTSAVTVVDEPYAITVKGSAQIGDGVQTLVYRYVDNEHTDDTTVNVGTWIDGEGFQGVLAEYDRLDIPGNDYAVRVDLEVALDQEYTINTIRLYTYIDAPLTGDGGYADVFVPTDPVGYQEHPQGTQVYTFTGLSLVSQTVRAVFDLGYSNDFPPTYVGADVRLVKIEVDVQVTGAVFADAFYSFNPDDETAAQLLPETQGLRINSTAVSVPPVYNSNHEYFILHEGDGNQIPFSFADTDYDDNQSSVLYIRVCGPGMGT